MVHYGHSCLVPITTTTLKMLYVFVEISFDPSHVRAPGRLLTLHRACSAVCVDALIGIWCVVSAAAAGGGDGKLPADDAPGCVGHHPVRWRCAAVALCDSR